MKEISFSLHPLRRYGRVLLVAAGILLLAEGAAWVCGARWGLLFKGIASSTDLLVQLSSPDWSAFADLVQPALNSVFIAIVGTVAGTVISLVFALLAASNLTPPWIRQPVRALLGLERALPEIVILLFLVAAFGLGPFAGVLALAIGSVGMLGKLIADAIEELDPVSIEAIQAVGATRVQVVVFGVIQPIVPSIISFALFRFEYSIRLSVVLGAVGAGGIGLELYRSFVQLDYGRATASLIVTLLLVFLSERLSGFLRKRIKEGGRFQ
ncbi:phosphonate ABC transporter, permease protein PhnE [Puia dinghuensis]|uniref:phosphonate ABC transporter, permease protein PhnE n=1 Tax=Puia dinghuensis TaxID=1792502 RepID=UPI00166D330A|nr:phosphonate ABC transporter, permease protein PhnE [Puia dinghuensis]